MATYAIGDVQGCFDELQDLLKKIQFNPLHDTLWFAGDLINRGPQSLEVLRFIRDLGPSHKVVLGNHDLHLLASWAHGNSISSKDTLQPILDAYDGEALCQWLRHQPIMLEDHQLKFMMVHAGVLPQWTLDQTRHYAREIEHTLKSEAYKNFLNHMYSNDDNVWHENLTGLPRLRTLVNVFTRIRYCDENGVMALTQKGELGTQSKGLHPWFVYPERKTRDQKIVFGHWAALEGKILGEHNVFSLDTGCVWGRSLRAMRLEDLEIFEVPSYQKKRS
ncbi:MAG: symmetrical bis(5'-nucleosyl)-tetraphosphatase [Pseudomonadota bacterium]